MKHFGHLICLTVLMVLIGLFFSDSALASSTGSILISLSDTREVLTATVETQYGSLVQFTCGSGQASASFNVYYDFSKASSGIEQGSLAAAVQTDETGSALVENLPAGNYRIEETGFSETGRRILESVTVKAGKETQAVFPARLTQTKLILEAKDQTIESSSYDGEALSHTFGETEAEDAVYGLFTAEAIQLDQNVTLELDTLVGLFEITDGYAELDTILPRGAYHVRQIKASEGYVLNETVYPVTLEGGENAPVYQYVTEEAVTHALLFGKAQIVKIDSSTGRKLKDTTIRIVTKEDEPVCNVRTDENGEAVIENLPFGYYFAVEESVPSGYRKDTSPKAFSITESGQTVRLETTPFTSLSQKALSYGEEIDMFESQPLLPQLIQSYFLGAHPLFGFLLPAGLILFTAGSVLLAFHLHKIFKKHKSFRLRPRKTNA